MRELLKWLDGVVPPAAVAIIGLIIVVAGIKAYYPKRGRIPTLVIWMGWSNLILAWGSANSFISTPTEQGGAWWLQFIGTLIGWTMVAGALSALLTLITISFVPRSCTHCRQKARHKCSKCEKNLCRKHILGSGDNIRCQKCVQPAQANRLCEFCDARAVWYCEACERPACGDHISQEALCPTCARAQVPPVR